MIAQIERAIAARIRAADFGYSLGTVSSYDEAVTQVENGVLQMPSAWVTYDGEDKPERLDNRRYRRRLEFYVYVAATQWVNVGFVRGKEDTGKPGAYQITDDIWFLLTDQDLGLEISPLSPGEIRPDVPEPGITICKLALTCDVTASPPEEAGDIADYLRHHIDWDVDPIGNVQPPLPTDVADVRDDIEIRQP